MSSKDAFSAADTRLEENDSTFEGIGLDPKAAWYGNAVLYGTAGAIVLLLYSFSSLIPSADAVIGVAGISTVPLFFLGARYWPTASWAPHVRATVGLTMLGAGLFLTGRPVTAMLLLMLFPMLATAYMLMPRHSIFYNVIGVVLVCTALLRFATVTEAIATTVTIVMLASATIFSQYQLRKIAEAAGD